MKAHLDFETRSAKPIEHGAWAYSKHKTTSVLCAALAVDKLPVQLLIDTEEIKAKLVELKDKGAIFCAHNAAFEYAICKNVLGVHIPFEQWECTAALSAFYGLPRKLGDVAKKLRLAKQKDEAGKKVMQMMAKPLPENRWLSTGRWLEDQNSKDILYSYCKDDVETERALEYGLGALPEDEQQVWLLDQRINQRGMNIDLPLCRAAVFAAGTDGAALV